MWVSITACDGLDGPGSNPGGVEIFCTRPDGPWGPSSLLYDEYRVSFPDLKRLGRDVDHQYPPSAEVKARIELFLYFPSLCLHELF